MCALKPTSPRRASGSRRKTQVLGRGVSLCAAILILLGANNLARPATSTASDAPIKLSRSEGARYMRMALHRRFGNFWDLAHARRVHCPKRVARGRVRCKISWVVSDFEFFGKGAIWVTYDRRGIPYWNYRYQITRFDEYCAFVLHYSRQRCVRVFVVR